MRQTNHYSLAGYGALIVLAMCLPILGLVQTQAAPPPPPPEGRPIDRAFALDQTVTANTPIFSNNSGKGITLGQKASLLRIGVTSEEAEAVHLTVHDGTTKYDLGQLWSALGATIPAGAPHTAEFPAQGQDASGNTLYYNLEFTTNGTITYGALHEDRK